MRKAEKGLIPIEVIEGRVLILRGRRVMLDRDLANLYGVETRVLNQAVSRNAERFPEDFMFQLTLQEGKMVMRSRSQSVILKRGRNVKYRPYVFTEHGAVMLANVLRSPVAMRASIQVVRAFVHLREMLATNQDLARKIEALERKVGKHDGDLQAILKVLHDLWHRPPAPPKHPLGFAPQMKALGSPSAVSLKRSAKSPARFPASNRTK
jgi:phage regulator Rha-like protein